MGTRNSVSSTSEGVNSGSSEVENGVHDRVSAANWSSSRFTKGYGSWNRATLREVRCGTDSLYAAVDVGFGKVNTCFHPLGESSRRIGFAW